MGRNRYDEAADEPDSRYAPQPQPRAREREQRGEGDGIFRRTPSDNSGGAVGARVPEDSGVDDADEPKPISVSELLYSSSSYYAIAKPGEKTNMLPLCFLL